MKKLAAAQEREIAAKTDATINFSETPEVIDWSGAEVGRFYRPTKRPVTIRLDDDVITWLKSYGRGYQTKANTLLRHAMESTRNAAASSRKALRQENIKQVYAAHLRIEPQFDDEPEFVRQVEGAVNGILLLHSPTNLALIKIDNWFGSRWLGFKGKALGQLGITLRPEWFTTDKVRIPPFVPERVVSQRRFAAPDFRETDPGKAVHQHVSSSKALMRKAAIEEPETALVWYSGNSKLNGRGSLMVYVPIGNEYWGWFAELERGNPWRIKTAWEIKPDELSHLIEEGSGPLGAPPEMRPSCA